jgi:hypothetical protein
VTLSWKTSRIGVVSLTLRADPANVLGETDESNNEAAFTVDVAASTEPNLVVQSTGISLDPEPALEGMPLRVRALVRNVGLVDAGPFEVAFFAGDPEVGGLPLGSVSLSGIPSSSEASVEVLWPDVTLRGQQLFHVLVDDGQAVAEFDETDNRAFKVSTLTGLPDLVASSAEVRLEPAFPRAGETVAIEASFTNVGAQEAQSFDASIRLDDPVSGAVLGSVAGASLPAGQTFTFTGSWDTTGLAGDHALFLVLDVKGAVREQREDNNTAVIPAAVQDADIFATPLYFSPNGDGIQDEAVFFFRTSSATEVSVSVVDSDQVPVRELLSGAVANGSAVWDGRNDAGVLVADEEYSFVLTSSEGEIARRRVVLDTNRSSLAEALGTPFTALSNLTCPLPGGLRTRGPVWLPDDSAALFIVRTPVGWQWELDARNQFNSRRKEVARRQNDKKQCGSAGAASTRVAWLTQPCEEREASVRGRRTRRGKADGGVPRRVDPGEEVYGFVGEWARFRSRVRRVSRHREIDGGGGRRSTEGRLPIGVRAPSG